MTSTTENAAQAADEEWKKAEAPAQLPSRRRLQPYLLGEMGNLPTRNPLVKGILDRGGMSVVYGDSNSGKTFIAIDICLHLTLGRDWAGHRVRQKYRVLYVAAEGGFGIRERLHAFLRHHAIDGDVLFYLIPSSVNFCSSMADAEEIIREATALGGVDIIVIDTLSRAIAGGNENSPDDMGKLIGNCDLLRQQTGAHVMVIHHTGKDAARGARGHSSLRAATDTEIEVVKTEDESIAMEITKQRDGKTGNKLHFMLEVVTLGQDEDGDPITSCVLCPMEVPAYKTGRPRPTSAQKRALDVMTNLVIEKGVMGQPKAGMSDVKYVLLADLRDALKMANITSSDKPDSVRKAIDRAIDKLNDIGFTASYEDKIWLLDNRDND